MTKPAPDPDRRPNYSGRNALGVAINHALWRRRTGQAGARRSRGWWLLFAILIIVLALIVFLAVKARAEGYEDVASRQVFAAPAVKLPGS